MLRINDTQKHTVLYILEIDNKSYKCHVWLLRIINLIRSIESRVYLFGYAL